MLPRFKSIVVLTFIVLALYAIIFWRDVPFSSGQHAIDVLKGSFGVFEVPWDTQDTSTSLYSAPEETQRPDSDNGKLKDIQPETTSSKDTHVAPTYFSYLPSEPESTPPTKLENAWKNTKSGHNSSTKTAVELLKPSSVSGSDNGYNSLSLQTQFDNEYEDLALNENAGAIYGNTLNALVDVGAHEGFAAAAIKPSKSSSSYSNTPAYSYNPYPDYNSKAWQAGNQGVYKACKGPNGHIPDLVVYSGHPKPFSNPQMGSYIPLDIDSNFCFERETRLGPYGFQAHETPQATASPEEFDPQMTASKELEERDAAVLDWGRLQQMCYKMNLNRFNRPQAQRPLLAVDEGNFTVPFNRTGKFRPSTMARRLDTIMKKLLRFRQGENKDMFDTEISGADSKADYLPEFQSEQFDDVSPFSGFGEGKSTGESSQSDDTKTYSLGGEKYNNDNSHDLTLPLKEKPTLEDDAFRFSGTGDVNSGKETPEHDDASFSELDDDESLKEVPQHDISQWSNFNQDEGDQEPEKEDSKYPGIAEDPPVTQGLSGDEAKAQGLHGMPPKIEIKPTPRTAVVIRTYSQLNFTENDKQNIRAMVSELSLRSGGEYEVFLLVEWKDETLPIFSGKVIYKQALEKSVPKEFTTMTVLWNDVKMRETYPLIPREVNNVHQSQWLSVQWFAQEHPEFDFYWNWEFDTRYTGHYYNLLEKLATFAKAQPRKGLWERNERYYIPSYHGRWSNFIKMVEQSVGAETVWGAPPVVNVTYIGSGPPTKDPKDDKYIWGVGEDADYISLSPIFNPVNTSWPGRNDVWGYGGPEKTPRRATIGTQSRCSKKLLDTMHAENKIGNHVSGEMTPQTVSLLHGLKAVYAPVPMFFDRPWAGESLQRYFNPGPQGQSGSSEESPYSWGREVRFQGSTCHYRATSPQNLYNNWLGWEDSGIGGAEWEKSHGRMCLPPLLLHPIKNVDQPPPGSSSKSKLPS